MHDHLSHCENELVKCLVINLIANAHNNPRVLVDVFEPKLEWGLFKRIPTTTAVDSWQYPASFDFILVLM